MSTESGKTEGPPPERAFPRRMSSDTLDAIRTVLREADDEALIAFLNGYAVGSILETLLSQLPEKVRGATIVQLRDGHPEWFKGANDYCRVVRSPAPPDALQTQHMRRVRGETSRAVG